MINLRSMPLLPEEGFTLHLSGQPEGERFADIFRQTWHHLPVMARHALIARWWRVLETPRPADIPTVPCFILAESLADPPGTGIAGLYLDHLNVFAWHGPTMAWLPDDLVAAAVAHELAQGSWLRSATRRWTRSMSSTC
jgi:hypothetical protein